jgi:hypothetical protein
MVEAGKTRANALAGLGDDIMKGVKQYQVNKEVLNTTVAKNDAFIASNPELLSDTDNLDPKLKSAINKRKDGNFSLSSESLLNTYFTTAQSLADAQQTRELGDIKLKNLNLETTTLGNELNQANVTRQEDIKLGEIFDKNIDANGNIDRDAIFEDAAKATYSYTDVLTDKKVTNKGISLSVVTEQLKNYTESLPEVDEVDTDELIEMGNTFAQRKADDYAINYQRDKGKQLAVSEYKEQYALAGGTETEEFDKHIKNEVEVSKVLVPDAIKLEEDNRFKSKIGGIVSTAATVNQTVNEIKDYLKDAGPAGRFVASGYIRGGGYAKSLEQQLTQLQAVAGFKALQDMRAASKTGGALGQIAVREIELLQSTEAQLAGLSGRSSDEVLKEVDKYAYITNRAALRVIEEEHKQGGFKRLQDLGINQNTLDFLYDTIQKQEASENYSTITAINGGNLVHDNPNFVPINIRVERKLYETNPTMYRHQYFGEDLKQNVKTPNPNAKANLAMGGVENENQALTPRDSNLLKNNPFVGGQQNGNQSINTPSNNIGMVDEDNDIIINDIKIKSTDN